MFDKAVRGNMAGSMVMLDANALMEIYFGRLRRQLVLRSMSKDPSAQYVTSILSADLLFYFIEKEKQSKPDGHEFLQTYKILDMNETDYLWAASNDQNDFEDALQVACALRHGCRTILTLDKGLSDNHRKHIATILVR